MNRLSLRITGWSSRLQENYRSFGGIYRTYPNLIKENWKTSTCNRMDLQTLRCPPFMPNNLRDHWAARPSPPSAGQAKKSKRSRQIPLVQIGEHGSVGPPSPVEFIPQPGTWVALSNSIYKIILVFSFVSISHWWRRKKKHDVSSWVKKEDSCCIGFIFGVCTWLCSMCLICKHWHVKKMGECFNI